MAFLGQINYDQKSRLKKQKTRITTRNGDVFEETLSLEEGFEKVQIGSGASIEFLNESENGFSSLKCKRFDATEQLWKESGTSFPSISKTDVKLVTYNVWFSSKNWLNRAIVLFRIVKDQDPDVICFQEVTSDFLKVLLREDWVRNLYFISDALGSTVVPYGVVILSKIPMKHLTIHTLPTNMGRRFLMCELEVSGCTIHIGTVHLESMQNTQIRLQQLERIQSITQSFSNVFILGDFNFHVQSTENRFIADLDAWAKLHGLTDPQKSRRGPMIDRVISKSQVFVPTSMQVLGCEPVVPFDGHIIDIKDVTLAEKTFPLEYYPSDHDGLSVVFHNSKID